MTALASSASVLSAASGVVASSVLSAIEAGEVLRIRKTVRSTWLDELLADRTASERHQIKTVPKVETGYWSWAGDRHSVSIGEGIREKKEGGGGLEAYVAAFLRHELSHAMWTERDLKAVDAKCKAVGVPFRLLNLFEDARIEEAYRLEYDRPFNWLDHEPMPEGDEAHADYFKLIQAEGAMLAEWEALAPGEQKARVAHYYRRTINAADTWEVVEIAAEWVKEFPTPPDQEMPGFGFDMGMSLQVQIGERDEKDATVVVAVPGEKADDFEPAEAPEVDPEARPNVNADPTASTHRVLAPKGKALSEREQSLALALANRMGREFVTRKGWTSTVSPTRRISGRRLSMDSDAVYRERTEARAGKIKLRVIVDLSGSMAGDPSEAARVVMRALAILSARGLAEGSVTFSAAHGYETFPLALSDEQIGKIEGYSGAEGLQLTFRNLERQLKDADMVMCLTDGQITDGPVNVSRLRAQGIRCMGLYVGDHGSDEDLSRWFAQSLRCSTIQELTDQIAIRMRPFIRGKMARA